MLASSMLRHARHLPPGWLVLFITHAVPSVSTSDCRFVPDVTLYWPPKYEASCGGLRDIVRREEPLLCANWVNDGVLNDAPAQISESLVKFNAFRADVLEVQTASHLAP